LNKLLALLVGTLLAAPALADVHIRPINAATTVDFKLYNADGTLDVDEVDSGTEVSVSCAGGAETTAASDFVDEGNFYSIALSQAEMNCARVTVVVAATTTEVFHIETFGTGGALGVLNVNVSTVTAGAIDASAIATDAIGAAELAADSITSSEVAATGATEIGQATWDEPTAGNVTAGTFGEQLKTDVDDILTDTGTTLDDFIDTEIAALVTAVDNVDNFVDTEIATLQTSVTAVDDFVDTEVAALVTAVDNVDNFVDTEIADIRRAQGPATTTIASLASQTSFTLTAGSADDNAYNGYGIVIIDASTAAQSALGCVLDYTGTTKTVTLRSDPGIFTMATSDNAVLLPSFCTTGVDVSTIETVDATDQLDTHAAAGLDAAGVRAAVGLASANLDTQLTNIDNFIDTEVADILTDTGTTLDDFIDTEIAALVTAVNAVDDYVDTEIATLQTSVTAVDDFVDTEIATLQTSVTAVDDYVDTEVAAILEDTGTTLQAEIDGVQADTENIQTRIPAALNNGVMPADVQRVNDVEITGDGSATPFNVP
jgi:hypothetical protein